MGHLLQQEIEFAIRKRGVPALVSRQGSALCVYFMDHAPVDWHDIAANHDFQADEQFRRQLIERGVYVFPLATKQWSISAAHSEEDIARTIEAVEAALEPVPVEH